MRFFLHFSDPCLRDHMGRESWFRAPNIGIIFACVLVGIMHTLDTDSDWSLLFYFLLSF